LEVSTDKVDTEIPSPVAGTLLEIKATEDETVEVGAVLALVGSADESGGGGEAAGDGGEQAQAALAEEPAEQPARQPAEPPLEHEREEREGAHAQAEQADTPEESAPTEPAAEQKDEAPREDVASATASAAQTSGEQTVVRLPELGESVTEGTVTRWLK